MRNTLTVRFAIFSLAIAGAPVSEAGVFAFAGARLGVNQYSINGSTYAHAEAVSAGTFFTPMYAGNAHTSPPASCSFPCIQATPGQFESAASSIDGVTGKGRAYAHALPGNAPPSGLDYAYAEAGFTLTDQLSINTAAGLMATLNISFDMFLNDATGGANDFSAVSAIYSLAFSDPLDSLLRYVVTIEANRSLDAGVRDDVYRISAGWDGDLPDVIEEGSAIPLALSATVAAPLETNFPSQVFDVELNLNVHATCQTLARPACAAIVSSPNSTHIGLVGDYTSQNSYGYLGLDPGSGAVPEPATTLLVGAALAVLGVRRRLLT